ncbi:MAG: diacylglycerol/lipid kinase family protein [Eubacteriales bacterium]
MVCIGGDGTLNEVVAGLCALPEDKRPPVGYIPAGTTNDFAASIGLLSDPIEAAKFMMNAKARQMDCGRLDGHVFNYVASFGAFTEVSYGTPQQLKNMLGHLAYILEGVMRFGDIRPTRLRFETSDGVVIEDEFLFGAFANTLSIGGVIKLDPTEVDFCDGLHEYLLVKTPKNPVEFHEAAQEIMKLQNPDQPREAKFVSFGSFSRGMITTDEKKLAWSLDGECCETSGEAVIENLHAAYSLLADGK